MDYFEATIARILEERGYWVRENVRVALARDVKKSLGKGSLPRCEIDIVAYQPRKKRLVLFEVKSYLDSKGVQPADLLRTEWENNRYKLLTLPALQHAVRAALLAEYCSQGLIPKNVQVRFGLAAGYIKVSNDKEVRRIARLNRWVFLGPTEIARAIWSFADLGYENSPFVLTAKLLRRHPSPLPTTKVKNAKT